MTLPGSPVDPVGGNATTRSGSTGRPLSLEDFVVLNDEIRAFVRAEIPLDVGLRGTASRADGRLREVAERISDHVSQGQSLQAAIAAEGNAIPAEYRAILTAGLKSGRLSDLLSSMSELGQSVADLRRQLRLSLIYPATVFVLAYILFTGFVVFVVPHLLRTQTVFRTEETFVTRRLSTLLETVGIWAPIIPCVLIVGGILMFLKRHFMSREPHVLDGIRWLPGARDAALSRFARVMTVLVDHDVPLPEACRLSGEATGRESLRQVGDHLAQHIEAGQSLEAAVKQEPQLPAFLGWLMSVGEQQGALPASLKQATDVYEQRALAKLDWFRRIVPPTIVLLVGGTITLIYALSLFLPMTQLLESLSGVSR
ncbi:MAG: type II secretion system F family protein [Planctomycetaceae bacterium]|nr:type II secretion system F family protein [Planctomycetaceae bacterium]